METSNRMICDTCRHMTRHNDKTECNAQEQGKSIWNLVEPSFENRDKIKAVCEVINQNELKAGMGARLAAPALVSLIGECSNYERK